MYRRIVSIALIVIWGGAFAIAQSPSINLSAEEVAGYKEQSKMMISYLEGTLNFLGDPQEIIAEKEIIINESYLKIFQNAEVQIEDDLDENREVPLRKDVQAYLKDIIFFYKQVKFTFEVNDVEQLVSNNGEIVFKVTVNRKLDGVTVNNDTVSNSQLRYVEINLDPYNKDLRIASIYSTKPNPKDEMRYWWATLPLPWRDFFGKRMLVFDTLPMSSVACFNDSLAVIMKSRQVVEPDSLLISNGDTLRFFRLPELDSGTYKIVYRYDTLFEKIPDTVKTNVSELDSYLKTLFNTKNLDISNNYLIQTLEPLSRLTALERLNASNMLVSDLSPLRNLNKLHELNLSGTAIKKLEPLRFSFNLKELDLSNTEVDSLQAISGLSKLEKLILDSTLVTDLTPLSELNNLSFLSIAGTRVTNLTPLGKLPALKRLILNRSAVSDISPLKELSALEYINIDNTKVDDLSLLESDTALTIIQANNSQIESLEPLENNKNLKLIYCDNAGINRDEAIAFMEKNPKCLVIFDSQRLVNWWNNMPVEWKSVLSEGYNIKGSPTKEQLHKIVNKKRLILANNKAIKSLTPVKMLFRLEYIDISNTSVNDLSPLAGESNLRVLNLNGTPVSDLSGLNSLTNLREISFENTPVSDLKPLMKNNRLHKIYCDGSNVTTNQVLHFKSVYPDCLIVYQTEVLQFWWNNLSDVWQNELSAQLKADGNLSKEQLQELVDLHKIVIKHNSEITDVEPLSLFHLLREAYISFTSISDLSPLTECDSLKVLSLPNNPIVEIEPLSRMKSLVELNLENTGIDGLTPLANLKNLQSLNIAGTKVRSLKPLANLTNLQELTINNTKIRRLTDIDGLTHLKRLTCYNTSLKDKRVESYKIAHPGVEVIFY